MHVLNNLERKHSSTSYQWRHKVFATWREISCSATENHYWPASLRSWPANATLCIYRFAPSQWETVFLCNDVSNRLGASLESALYICRCRYSQSTYNVHENDFTRLFIQGPLKKHPCTINRDCMAKFKPIIYAPILHQVAARGCQSRASVS